MLRLPCLPNFVCAGAFLQANTLRGRGGGDPCIKRTRVPIGKFEKNPKGYNNAVLRQWAWLGIFSPLRGSNSSLTHYLLPYFFRLNIR